MTVHPTTLYELARAIQHDIERDARQRGRWSLGAEPRGWDVRSVLAVAAIVLALIAITTFGG